MIKMFRRIDNAIHRALWRVYLRDRYRRVARKRSGSVYQSRHEVALDVSRALTADWQDDLATPMPYKRTSSRSGEVRL